MRPTPALEDGDGPLPAPTPWRMDLEVVTPMFGGSATTRQVDPQQPIRAASVRGHLRFWWRAIYGRRYATAAELFEAEEAIFGSDRAHGRASLNVTTTDQGKEVDYSAWCRLGAATAARPRPWQPACAS